MNREYFGFRNLIFNYRHHYYPGSFTMMDIDILEYDYQTGLPLLMAETKYATVSSIDLNDIEFKVMNRLAEPFACPTFCLIYFPFKLDGSFLTYSEADPECSKLDHIQFYAVPLNTHAKLFLPEPTQMTEVEWVSLVYELRKEHYNPPRSLYNKWKTVQLPKIIK